MAETVELEGPRPRRRFPVVLLAVLIVLVASAIGSYFFFFVGRSSPDSKPPVTYEVGEFLTNLAEPDSSRLVRVSMTFLVQPQAVEELTEKDAAMREAVLRVLRGYTSQDLDGRGGVDRLSREVRAAVNGVITGGEVERVYITDFLVD